MYKPFYSKRFEKQIQKFPKKEQLKILEKIIKCLENPRQYSIKLSTTQPPVYRLRVGEYRVFFELDNQIQIMIVTDVERRTTQTYR